MNSLYIKLKWCDQVRHYPFHSTILHSTVEALLFHSTFLYSTVQSVAFSWCVLHSTVEA